MYNIESVFSMSVSDRHKKSNEYHYADHMYVLVRVVVFDVSELESSYWDLHVFK